MFAFVERGHRLEWTKQNETFAFIVHWFTSMLMNFNILRTNRIIFWQSFYNGRWALRHSTSRIIFVWRKCWFKLPWKSSNCSTFWLFVRRRFLCFIRNLFFFCSFHIRRLKPMNRRKPSNVWWTFAKNLCALSKRKKTRSKTTEVWAQPQMHSTLSSSLTLMQSVRSQYITFALKKWHQMALGKFDWIESIELGKYWIIWFKLCATWSIVDVRDVPLQTWIEPVVLEVLACFQSVAA